jgi:hypothetical protein
MSLIYTISDSADVHSTIDNSSINTISIGNSADTITISPPHAYNIGSTWTTMASTSASPYSIGGYTTNNSISVNGENADIMINGRSIVDVLDRLEQQMGWLNPKPEIEKEWEELKRLGDEYRALEADIKEKMKVWDILKNPVE